MAAAAAPAAAAVAADGNWSGSLPASDLSQRRQTRWMTWTWRMGRC